MATTQREEQARKGAAMEGAGRSIAQLFCLAGGSVLVAIGILGFFFGGDNFNTGDSIQGEEFIGFEVNGWHNVVHIATGAFLLLMAPTAASAITGALIFAAAYIGVTIWGFIDGNTVVALFPVNTADNVLHAVLAGAAIVAAMASGGLAEAGRRKDPAASSRV